MEGSHSIRIAWRGVEAWSVQQRSKPEGLAYRRLTASTGAAATKAPVRNSRIPEPLLVVPSALTDDLPLDGAMLTEWEVYDEQYLYFYNYRLNKYRVHVTYTWCIGDG